MAYLSLTHLSLRCSSTTTVPTERQQLFNRIAPVYDNLNDLLSLGQHRIWKRMAVSWTGAKKGDRVLDLCCGSGDLAFLLSENVGSTGKVIGLDFSNKQLGIASSRQNSMGNPCFNNIEWVEGDAMDLPFPDASFDAITMGYGLRNVVDKRVALQEITRVLKPGSTASILDFNKSSQPFVTGFQYLNLIERKIMLQPSGFRRHYNDNNVEEWMIDNVVIPMANGYGLAEDYMYLKSSIAEFLTGKELEMLALEAGFSNAKHYQIGGGLMGNLVARC